MLQIFDQSPHVKKQYNLSARSSLSLYEYAAGHPLHIQDQLFLEISQTQFEFSTARGKTRKLLFYF